MSPNPPLLAQTREPEAPPASRFLDLIHDKLLATELVFRQHLASDVPFIQNAGQYIFAGGGKRMRPAMLLLAARLLERDSDEEVTYAAVVELIHTATLVHDDIIDHATLRRGQATVNRVWGNSRTVLLGDWLYTTAMQMALRHDNLEVIRRLCEATLRMTEGELLALERLGALDLTVEEYFRIIERKTAQLFVAACTIPSLMRPERPGAGEALARYGQALGNCFQLVDDLLDFTACERELGKPVLSDLKEGKLTLPLIVLLPRLDAKRRRLIDMVLEDGDFKRVAPDQILELVASGGTLAEVDDMAERYAEEARRELAHFSPSAARDALVFAPVFVLQGRSLPHRLEPEDASESGLVRDEPRARHGIGGKYLGPGHRADAYQRDVAEGPRLGVSPGPAAGHGDEIGVGPLALRIGGTLTDEDEPHRSLPGREPEAEIPGHLPSPVERDPGVEGRQAAAHRPELDPFLGLPTRQGALGVHRCSATPQLGKKGNRVAELRTAPPSGRRRAPDVGWLRGFQLGLQVGEPAAVPPDGAPVAIADDPNHALAARNLQAEQQAADAPTAPQLHHQAIPPRAQQWPHLVDVHGGALGVAVGAHDAAVERCHVLFVCETQQTAALGPEIQLELSDQIEGHRAVLEGQPGGPDPASPLGVEKVPGEERPDAPFGSAEDGQTGDHPHEPAQAEGRPRRRGFGRPGHAAESSTPPV